MEDLFWRLELKWPRNVFFNWFSVCIAPSRLHTAYHHNFKMQLTNLIWLTFLKSCSQVWFPSCCEHQLGIIIEANNARLRAVTIAVTTNLNTTSTSPLKAIAACQILSSSSSWPISKKVVDSHSSPSRIFVNKKKRSTVRRTQHNARSSGISWELLWIAEQNATNFAEPVQREILSSKSNTTTTKSR